MLLRPLVYYVAARIVPAGMSLLFMVVCAQTLSASEYGLFTLTSLPALIVAGFTAGLAGQPMLRFATGLSAPGVRAGLFRVPLAISLPLVPLLLAYMLGVGHPLVLTAIVLGLVPLTSLLDTRRNYLISLSRVRDVFLLDAVRSIVSIVVLVALVAVGVRNSKAPLIAMVAAAAISLLIFSFDNDEAAGHGAAVVDRGYLLYGFWVACWLAVVGAFPYLERSFLNVRYDVAVAGTYSIIADPMSAISSASVAVIVSAFMPLYVAAWTADRHAEIRRLSRIAIGSLVLIGLGVLVVGVAITSLGIGKYARILRDQPALGLWLLAASTVWQVSMFLHKPLELRSQTRHMFACLVVAALGFGVVAFPLMRQFGVAGVAMAKTFAGLLYMALVLFVGRDLPVPA